PLCLAPHCSMHIPRMASDDEHFSRIQCHHTFVLTPVTRLLDPPRGLVLFGLANALVWAICGLRLCRNGRRLFFLFGVFVDEIGKDSLATPAQVVTRTRRRVRSIFPL